MRRHWLRITVDAAAAVNGSDGDGGLTCGN